jgi:D-hexose-6-phosphate mutarotase
MKVHKKRIETLEIIKFKTKTTQQLSDLEKEILSYDLSKRDDIFNCQKALNTYIRLEKITHNEIKRIDQQERQKRINAVRSEQTEAQKQRTAENRNKYFLGASVLRLKQIFKQDHVDDVDFLRWISIAALMWKGADQTYKLNDEKYLEKIIPHIREQLNEVSAFIEQAKNDSRQ